jgi:hypothetical protein
MQVFKYPPEADQTILAPLTVARQSGVADPHVSVTIHSSGLDGANNVNLIDAYGGAANLTFRRCQGTEAAPSAVTAIGSIGGFNFYGYGATGYSSGSRASILAVPQETWTDAAQGTELRFLVTPSGSSTEAVGMALKGDKSLVIGQNSIESSAALQVSSVTKGFLPPKMTSAQKLAISSPASGLTVYDTTKNARAYYNGSNWIHDLQITTWASLPSAVTVAPYQDQYFVTDYPGGAQRVYSNGSKWKTFGTQAANAYIVEATPNTTTSTSEVIIKSTLLPAGFLQIGDFVDFVIQVSKDNTTNAQTLTARIGTTGTTADTQASTSASVMGATTTNTTLRLFSFVVTSATTVDLILATSGTAATTATRTVTIPNISNALYLSAGINNVTSTATTISQNAYSLTITK